MTEIEALHWCIENNAVIVFQGEFVTIELYNCSTMAKGFTNAVEQHIKEFAPKPNDYYKNKVAEDIKLHQQKKN